MITCYRITNSEYTNNNEENGKNKEEKGRGSSDFHNFLPIFPLPFFNP